MRAALLRKGKFVVGEFPDPVPAPGQALVKSLACGICGSDLHLVDSSAKDEQSEGAFPERTDLDKDFVMGHEFCCEVVETRAGSRFKAGDRVVSYPYIVGTAGPEILGFSHAYPGGFGERMVLMEDWLLAVPNGISPDLAALTEPLSVGLHAVNRSGIAPGDVAMVVGCGPVGLAVITALKAAGCGPVIASDFSPQRRALAERIGADVVVNPAETEIASQWAMVGIVSKYNFMMTAYAMREQFRRCVAFECVGAPGLIQAIIAGAPLNTTIVGVGLCGAQDRFEPSMMLLKEVDLRYAVSYTHEEFALMLRRIAEGVVDVAPFITARAGFDSMDQAFSALHDAGSHAKIIIRPDLHGFH